MTSRGYETISEKFYLNTGLRHSRTQLKNRWDQLKGLYSFWLWLNKQAGLGRSNGIVVIDDDFWKYTKVLVSLFVGIIYVLIVNLFASSLMA
jgi:hypothetical protein